jgi:hypothetical protein
MDEKIVVYCGMQELITFHITNEVLGTSIDRCLQIVVFVFLGCLEPSKLVDSNLF